MARKHRRSKTKPRVVNPKKQRQRDVRANDSGLADIVESFRSKVISHIFIPNHVITIVTHGSEDNWGDHDAMREHIEKALKTWRLSST